MCLLELAKLRQHGPPKIRAASTPSYEGLSEQEQAKRMTSDKMPCAGIRRKVRFLDGCGAECCGYGAASLRCCGRRNGELGIVGSGPRLDAVDVARSGWCASCFR